MLGTPSARSRRPPRESPDRPDAPVHDPQLLKGVLSLVLLRVLHDDDAYGYAVVERLRDQGLTGLAEGSVYPALTRLESQGLLESRLQPSPAGPARKYYRTTPAGRAEADRLAHAWRHLVASVDTITGGAS